MDKQLEIVDLSFGYHHQNILQHIDMVVPKNKISIILGANGCGKSTLLKNMCRVLKPTQGNIYLDSQDIFEKSSKVLAKKIGLMPQSPQIPEGITVYDLVSRGRFPYREAFRSMTQKDYDMIEEAMELMGISHLAKCYVDELSGGQRQRVWIALALAQDTDILFLDEPTTFLDIQYQIDILDLLCDLNQKKGTTIVMVLHDINLSARYGDYIFALSKGRIIAHGRPNDILTESLVEEVYGIKCQIIEDPLSHSPLILPIGRHGMKETSTTKKARPKY